LRLLKLLFPNICIYIDLCVLLSNLNLWNLQVDRPYLKKSTRLGRIICAPTDKDA